MEKNKVESRTEYETCPLCGDELTAQCHIGSLHKKNGSEFCDDKPRPSVPEQGESFSKCPQCSATMWKVRKNAISSFEFCPNCASEKDDKRALAASRSEEATPQDDKCVIRRAQALATDIVESSLVHSDLTEWLLAYRKSEIYRAGAPAAGSSELRKCPHGVNITRINGHDYWICDYCNDALAQTDTDVPKEKL